MNILTYTGYPLDPKLGSGKTVLMFSEGLQKLGHNIEICIPEEYETWYGFERATQFRQALGSWRSIKKKLQSNKYDLIEFYGAEFWIAIRSLSKYSVRPLLVSHTNGLELLAFERMREFEPKPESLQEKLRDLFFRQTHERFTKIAYAKSDAFMAICETDRRFMVERGYYRPEWTAIVEPGIDEEYLSTPFSPNREDRIAFTGTWILRKGIDKIIKVMTEVLSKNIKLYFDVYGAGVAKDVVISSFPSQLQDRVTVHPRLSNRELAGSLAKAKVFFFPTQYEGFGIALAEAMACGLAAVTTPTGFGANLRDEQEAFVRDFNDVEGMKDNILSLLKDENLRRKIAENGWRRVQALRWETSVKKLESIYRDWVEEHKRRG